MERLKNMGLRRSFFLLSVVCLAMALLLTFGVYQTCNRITARYPTYGMEGSFFWQIKRTVVQWRGLFLADFVNNDAATGENYDLYRG